MPTAEAALPGRDGSMPGLADHLVLGTPLIPRFPDGTEQAIFGMGCFWGAERLFWQAPHVYTTAAGYSGGFTPNPTYQEVCSGATGHTEVVLAVFDTGGTSYEEMLRIFWEGHDPTQGMRGERRRNPVPLCDLLDDGRSARCRARVPGPVPARADAGRARLGHDRDRRGRAVLLRRAVPPAVPRGEPERLLRPGRDGRELSCASDSGERVTTGVPAGIVPSRASSRTSGSST